MRIGAGGSPTARRREVVASGLFLVLVGLGLAAADKPPPVGFILWGVLAAAASLVVWWRSPYWRGGWIPARDGAVAGLLAGAVLAIPGGEPTVEMPGWVPFATVLGLAALGALGGWLLGLVLVDRSGGAGGET